MQEIYSSLVHYVRLTNEVLDTVQEGFLFMNHQLEIQKTNKTFQLYMGLSEEEMLHKNLFTIIAESKYAVYQKMIEDAIESQKSQEIECFLDTQQKWFRVFLYPFEAGFIFILRDITDRKIREDILRKSERMLRAILDSTSDTNILVDTKGKILSFNKAAYQNFKDFYGIEIAEGQNILDYGLEKTKGAFQYDFEQASKGREIISERELFFPNGKTVWVQARMFPVYNENGEVWAVSLDYINIDKLKRQNDRLQEIARLQSHTIRRPLASIMGLVDIFDEEQLSPQNAKLLEYMKQSALELDQVIHEIVRKTEQP
jgi:PAS domain S-box-containing protein